MTHVPHTNPQSPDDQRELYYVKGILRNRLSYVPYDVIKTLTAAMQAGVPVEDMRLEAKHATSWTRFQNWLDQAIEGLDG